MWSLQREGHSWCTLDLELLLVSLCTWINSSCGVGVEMPSQFSPYSKEQLLSEDV